MEFVRKVAAYLGTDDQDVIAFERQLVLLGSQVETRIVLRLADKTELTIKLEEPA